MSLTPPLSAGVRTEGHATASRLHGLDFLRALMMSLGVVLHTAQIYLTVPAVDYYWDSARSQSMDVLLFFINTFRMPVFYLLSGFFTALLFERRGLHAMLKNRWQRIAIPFLLFLPPLAFIMTQLRIIGAHVMATGTFGYDPGLLGDHGPLWNNTHNLWFLYYLMAYVATSWLLVALWSRVQHKRKSRLLETVRRYPLYSLKMSLPVAAIVALLGATDWSGRVTADLSFAPSATVYLNFGLFFFLGWVLYFQRAVLAVMATRSTRYLGIATVCFVGALMMILIKVAPEEPGYAWQHALLCAVTGLSMVFYVLGFVGLFSKSGQRYNPWIRYFSDSAYWIFLFHSIPLVALALLIHSLPVVAELKFLIVCCGTLICCLGTYQLAVRNTYIGQILNGRRYQTTPWSKQSA